MRKLNVAVVGTGVMGKFHVRNYSEMPVVKLIAVCDINEKEGKKVASNFNCKFYKDYKQMTKKERLDIVSIAVPTKFHKDAAIHFLKNKINVLLEKPIADTIENAEKIINEAKKNKVKLTIGHIERFNPAVSKVKELIDSGRLGEINSIIVRRIGQYPIQIKDSDVVIDLAVHDIDIINYLLGRLPTNITANCGKSIGQHKNDYADIFMKYGKTSALIQVNWITPVKIRKLSINGSKGYLEMDYITQDIDLYESNYDKVTDDFGDFVIKFGSPKIIKIDVKKEEPLRGEILSFIDAVKYDKQPYVTTKQALDALKIAIKVSSFK